MATAYIGAAIPTTPTARRSTTAIIITAAEDIAELLTTFAGAVAPVTAVGAVFTTTPEHRHTRLAVTTTPHEDTGNRTGRAVCIPARSAATTMAVNHAASRPAAAAASVDFTVVVEDFTAAAVAVTAAVIANPNMKQLIVVP